MRMKKFIVNIWDENTYKKVFTANSKEEAEEIARKEIDEEGIQCGVNNWSTGSSADWDVTDVSEVKK